ncbi:MAG: glycosyltransferase family 2 protein [Rhodothermales bacterium]|nr:glycosyltransferase family 2 protein [Rhodothermales bacterium]
MSAPTQVHPLPVSIIIVSWNALPLLQRCLPDVVQTSEGHDAEIILADNASDDGSAEWVTAHFPTVRIVRHPENWAFCKGNNAAISHARGRYILLLNNDVEVTSGWLKPLLDTLDRYPSCAAVQPKLLQTGDRRRFEYAGASGGFLDAFGYPFTRGRLFFTMEVDAGQYDDNRRVFWATGAAILLRRSALDRCGLLDERFFMHMEEIDLCWRFQRAGYEIRVEPASVVHHIGGGSLPYGHARKAYFNFRNSLLMLYKNLPRRRWPAVFLARILLDGLAILRATATGHFAEAGSILRAYWDAHRMRRFYAGERPTGGEASVLPSYRGSIVVDYFVRGRRRFSELPSARFSEE